MTQYIRYCLQVTDGGRKIKIQAHNEKNETIKEPGGACQLADISEHILNLASKVRQGSARKAELDDLGEALFAALFPPEVTTQLRDELARVVKQQDTILRIELDLDEAEMPKAAALPWELLRAPQTDGRAVDNLGTHPKVVLSRRRALWEPATPVTLTEPLRILLVVSEPEECGPVAWQEIQTALDDFAKKHPKLIAPLIAPLHQPDVQKLDKALEEYRPHILHFIGHGKLRKAHGVEFGELALVKPGTDQVDWLTDEEVGELFQTHTPAVVVLQACDSGAQSKSGGLLGVASQIVQRNVPVVVAMQYPISNAAAVAFAEEFYQRLGELKAVDAAVQAGRRVVSQKYPQERDFGAPVLFMRVEDGQLFSPPAEKAHEDKGDKPAAAPVDVVEHFPDWCSSELPHPVAWACARFDAAQNDPDRFMALDQLVINLTKYLTAIALSQYWQDKPDREQLRQWFEQLSQAHLTTNLTILDQVSQHYAGTGQDNPLQAVLFAPYCKTLPEKSALGAALQTILQLQQGGRARKQLRADPSAQTFLQHLLALREARWEVAISNIDPQLQKTLLPVLRLALQEFIQHFRDLLNYPLYYIDSITRTRTGWIYTLTTFVGPEGIPEPVETAYTQTGGKSARYEAGYLYLFSPQGIPLLNLHPILIEHYLKLYFLEERIKKGEIWYEHCAWKERYQPPVHYHFISTRLAAPDEIAENENDLAAQLGQDRAEQRDADQKDRVVEMPLNILLARLSDQVRAALEIGLGEALRIGQFWLGVEFLLMGLSKLESSTLSTKLIAMGADDGDFRGRLRGLVPVSVEDWRKQRDVQSLGAAGLPQLQKLEPDQLQALYGTESMPKAILTPRLLEILQEATRLAGDGKVSDRHLLLACLGHPQSIAVNRLRKLIAHAKQDPNRWMKQLEREIKNEDKPEGEPQDEIKPEEPPADLPQPRQLQGVLIMLPNQGGVLEQLGRDLTALAQAGKLRPAAGEGARKAMAQIGLILQQTQANNPILLGDPGVGKTAVVEGLAWRLVNDPDVVKEMAGKRIIDLSLTALLAGTKYRGQMEQRLQQLLTEVREAEGKIIVFIDEIHTILGGRAEGGLSALSDALKPALARGEFPCIGATTVSEYRRHIETDPALARRFSPVWLEEPTPAEAIQIATQVAHEHLEPSHKVTYPPEVIAEAVRLAVRYLHDEFLPGKVIKLLDRAGPRVKMGISLRGIGGDPSQASGVPVTLEIVRQIVAERTGIPLASLSEDDKTKLIGLEAKLKERVKGQDEAVAEMARMVKRARTGLADPDRPLGVFLFAGPTGVGKTELALALAAALFDQEDAILRLDMSEYLELHQVSRLIGAPPGYIGSEEEGQLTGHLRRRPYSVVLLDEIEKAHKDVQHLFLQLFDAGRITDARGRVVDGRNAIFIMTTNLGAKEALGFANEPPPYEARLQAAIEKHFSSEFLNRVNRVIYFNPLTETLLLAIFDKFFAQAMRRFEAQGITVEVSEAFKRALCQKYTDAKRGARPLQRAIEDKIIAPLTDKLLIGGLKPGLETFLDKEGEVVAQQRSPAPKIAPLPPLAADEAANQALIKDLVQQLERESGLTLLLNEGALDILCGSHWLEQRDKLPTPQAFEQLVRLPLLEKLKAGAFQPGEQVEVFRNIDRIDFKKNAGGKK